MNPITFSRRSILAMPLALMACKLGEEVLKFSGQTMGTTFNVVARGDVDRRAVEQAVTTALADVNSKMSNWDASSEISRFNANEATDVIAVSAELNEVMQAAQSVHAASDGRFDTTMGPLIEAWGFGEPGSTGMPGDDAITAALSYSGHANTLSVGNGALAKKQPAVQIYLAAIGKGYGADLISRKLEDLGISDYLIEIGGDLYAAGTNADGMPWQIGVETPDAHNREVMKVVGVSGMGLASSGDYRNYFEVDGTRYSHVIDPVTGRPISHRTASATVLAENAMLADAWATAMLTLGRERGLEIAEQHDIAVLFVDRDQLKGDGYVTRASERFLDVTA